MTNEPIAYAAVAVDASESTYVTTSREHAEAACREHGWQLLPLYAGGGLQLSYQETEVLKSADALFQKCGLVQHAAVVRDILRRMGGGNECD